MSKLVYGKNEQLKFYNEDEKREAIDYILNSSVSNPVFSTLISSSKE